MLLVFVGDILGAGIYALVGEVGGEVGGAIWTAFIAALVLLERLLGSLALDLVQRSGRQVLVVAEPPA